MLAMAVPLHLGIGIFLGMMTFGLVMLIANLAFVEPRYVRAIIDRRWAAATGERQPDTSRGTSRTKGAMPAADISNGAGSSGGSLRRPTPRMQKH